MILRTCMMLTPLSVTQRHTSSLVFSLIPLLLLRFPLSRFLVQVLHRNGAMSFGVSVGDVIAVAKLASEVSVAIYTIIVSSDVDSRCRSTRDVHGQVTISARWRSGLICFAVASRQRETICMMSLQARRRSCRLSPAHYRFVKPRFVALGSSYKNAKVSGPRASGSWIG